MSGSHELFLLLLLLLLTLLPCPDLLFCHRVFLLQYLCLQRKRGGEVEQARKDKVMSSSEREKMREKDREKDRETVG